MDNATLLFESLRLMAIGMTIVFSFLMLLVVILRAMSWVTTRFSPLEMVLEPDYPRATAESETSALLPVISAALACYRARHMHST
jgi:oxaloacetate decarboxylase gamma subunit